MKLKKIAALGMTATMALSAMSIPSFAADSGITNLSKEKSEALARWEPSFGGYMDTKERCSIVDMITGEEIQLPTWEEAYAYLDYEAAPADVKDKILKARARIVFGETSWTVDQKMSIINADGTEVKLPEYSELFPADWDLKDISVKHNEMLQEEQSLLQAFSISSVYQRNVQVPIGTSGSATIREFIGNGRVVDTYAITFPSNDYRVNIGYTDLDTNTDAGWGANLTLNQGVRLYSKNSVRYRARCSSYISDRARAMVCFEMTGL